MKVRLKNILGVGMVLVIGAAGGAALTARAQQKDTLGYQDTPLVPGTKWHIHDGLRPQPPIIDPGTFSTQDTPGRPPSDAIVLFDGKDLSHWTNGNGGPAGWTVENGYMKIAPKSGSLVTKDQIGDCHLHVEWSSPTPPKGAGQGRGNSGVLFFGRYEIQVLDSYHAPTYPDGQASAVYGTYPPLVNAMNKPGEWNIYDIFFTVPRFKDGKLLTPGYFTVLHNGILVQDDVELLGTSNHRAAANYTPHPLRGSLVLQDHGDPVRYRNIWYRELNEYEQN